jgi:putative membrane protein insertion efficiency factor
VSDATRKFSTSRLGPGAFLARALIAAYRLTLSPLIGNTCRHLPTCSRYADEAIARHGLWAGGWMTVARLLRCQPFGTSGLDFVARTPPANDGAGSTIDPIADRRSVKKCMPATGAGMNGTQRRHHR